MPADHSTEDHVKLIGSGDVRYTADGIFRVQKEPEDRKGRPRNRIESAWRVWRRDRTTQTWQPATGTDATLSSAKSRIERMRRHGLG
jgi:hypothetical protein